MKREKAPPSSQETEQTPSPEPKRSKNEAIEAHLKHKYLFRFNTVKCKPEYKIAGIGMPFIPVTKFALNTFKRELDRESGISTVVS